MSVDALQRVVAGVEYKTMSGLLADFRKYLERESDGPIERLDANAALVLNDLCAFLGLAEPLRAKVLGKSAMAFVEAELQTRVNLPVIH